MSSIVSAPGHSETTRRGLIARLAVAGAAGMLAAASISHRAAAALPKLPPNEIGYQTTPKGNSRCELCVNWQAPNACKLVAGPISPNGWCGLFVHKA